MNPPTTSRGRYHVGTSGWHYDHWRGVFYPEKLPPAKMLAYYTAHFNTVEINNSFYRLPAPATFRKWRRQAPEGFQFSVKASRYLTHMKKLRPAPEALNLLLERAGLLQEKLGPVLFQLPPRWRINPDRLERFLASLPEGHRYVFEFRDHSWYDPAIYRLLAQYGAAFCIYELDRHQSPRQVTTDFIYIRLHGPAGPYQGSYDDRILSGWAGAFSCWAGQEGRDIYCYFDNDQAGYAVDNARRLLAMLEE